MIPVQTIVLKEEFDITKPIFNLENNEWINKPAKALWTSTFEENIKDISWIDWAEFNFPKILGNYLYKLYPKESTKIYTINTPEDYFSDELIKFDGREGECPRYLRNLIDYKKMKDLGYNGIHFTWQGAALGHGFNNFDNGLFHVLNSIDVESTVWFDTDWIDHTELITNKLLSILFDK